MRRIWNGSDETGRSLAIPPLNKIEIETNLLRLLGIE